MFPLSVFRTLAADLNVRLFFRYPNPFMQGQYKVIETFIEDDAKAVVAEDLYKPVPDGDWFISHEIALTVGSSSRLIMWPHEIPHVIAVLQKAKDLAEVRLMDFYLNDEASELSTPTL